MSILFVKQRTSVSEPPSGGRKGNICDPYLVGKLAVDLGYNEHFSLAVTARRTMG